MDQVGCATPAPTRDSGVDNIRHEYWQNYTDDQLGSLAKLLLNIEERYGIPIEFFEYENPHNYDKLSKEEVSKYSWYHYPEKDSDRIFYNEEVDKFNGILAHHNVTGKYDVGPVFDIDYFLDIIKARLE